MRRLIEMRDALVYAIDGDRILNEIVGADAEEIDFARQRAAEMAALGISIMAPTCMSSLNGDTLPLHFSLRTRPARRARGAAHRFLRSSGT